MAPQSSEGGNRQVYLVMGVIALVLLALGVGLLGGYLVGARGGASGAGPAALAALPASPAPAAGAAAPPVHQGPCPFDLPAADQWRLAGWTCNCNEAHCNRTPLLACHCERAHQMKTLAKQLIVEGADPNQIGAEMEKRWGAGIRPGA
jgi:hypothetical protein